ncbi:MAG TPA: diacylglycerol kinase family protein [Actinomycetota bacterium]|nr:diacylglycerol kinase family protein [Actinomycetota bacterium]
MASESPAEPSPEPPTGEVAAGRPAGSPYGKAFVIINRRAGKGARHPDEFARALTEVGLDYELTVTERRHHALELARGAIDNGSRFLVAVGGDGTIHEVVNGMMGPDGPRNPEAVLGIVSAGSGSDFARTFGLPDDVTHGLQHLTGDGYVEIDCGRVTYTTEEGEATRYFPNIAEAGLGADVVVRAEHLPRRLGRSRYLVGFWLSLARFKPCSGRVQVAERSYEGRIANVVVANCQFFGGGMHVAPKASPMDGRFDVLVQTGSKSDYVATIRKIFKGTHIPSPNIKEFRGRRVEVTTSRPVRLEADGEPLGTTPATFAIVENALKIKV